MEPPPNENLTPAEVISYASSASRRRPPLLRRHFHVWALPLVWLPGAWGSRVHHGDEYAAFAVANGPGALIYGGLDKSVGFPSLDIGSTLTTLVAFGFVLWVGVGCLLDRLRAWRWVYALMPLAFLAIVLSRVAAMGSVQPIPGQPPHPPGQEWEWDSVFVAYCWAVYAVAVVVLLGAAAAAIVRACARWAHGWSAAGTSGS